MKDHKQVDVAAYRVAIPELGAMDLVCTAGEFAGLRFSLDLPSGWRTTIPRPAFRSVTEFPEEDIVLTCDLGIVTLVKPMVTALDNYGSLTGVCIAVGLSTSQPTPETQCIFRTYVRVKSDIASHMIFPAAYEDPTSGWATRALLPIKVRGTDADFFVLRGQPPTVVIEGHGQLVAHQEFLRITSGIRRLFSFLTGRMCDGDTVDMVFLEETGALVSASWYEGRASENTIYQPIPTDPRYPFQAAPFSTCLQKLLDEPELIHPIEYLIAFASLPIEMRGVVLSVALESLTSHLFSKGLIPGGGLLSEDAWPDLRAALRATLDAAAITPKERETLGQRIDRMNSPTNKDKLTRPFDALEVPLNEDERKAVARRDRLLHVGRILPAGATETQSDAWREAHEVEMRIFESVSRLLLRHLGYDGPVLAWGESPRSGAYPRVRDIKGAPV